MESLEGSASRRHRRTLLDMWHGCSLYGGVSGGLFPCSSEYILAGVLKWYL